jgi:hypothetical protein
MEDTMSATGNGTASAPDGPETELLVFNGINGATGAYLIPPMAPATLAAIATGIRQDEEWGAGHLDELKYRHGLATQPNFAPISGVDPTKLEQTGWGVIFPAALDANVLAALKEALGELLTLRRAQAGELCREYSGADGYRTGESKDDFLTRHGSGPGVVDPARFPYYVLLVGDPESIPYRFQYEMDVAHAVGRLSFETLDEYAQYARSVVAAETGQVTLARRATFFGVQNPGDQATNLSAKYLIAPLADKVKADQATWQVDVLLKDQATKARLGALLGGGETPALLFTASHGVGFPNGDSRQLPHQGALLCQDWPGRGPDFSRDHYLAAEDVASDARLLGLISFHFACYGGGTPYWDDFAEQAFKNRSAIAPHAFIASLPRRLLGHPKGGALAVLGHVERAWTYSFQWRNNTGEQTATFQSVLRRLLQGDPIGWALEDLNTKYSEIAALLSNELEEAQWTKPNVYRLTSLWTANKDARGYAILGDPAVRLPVAADGAPTAERPTTEPVAHRATTIPLILVPDPRLAAQRAAAAPASAVGGFTGPIPSPDAPAPVGAGAAPMALDEALAMGIPGVDTIRDNLHRALGQLAARLAAFMSDVTTLEVATYVSDRVEDVASEPGTGRFTGDARQRALTQITFDGHTKICVPTNAGQIDDALWTIHTAMVQQAQANRAAMIKTSADVLASLLHLAKPV